MVSYPKQAVTFDNQLELLIERGLEINDRAKALDTLSRISYYRLSGYWHPFRDNPGEGFIAGANFDTVLGLYDFDRKLRLLVMDALERVEVTLRTDLTYHLAHAFGPFAHTNPANYRRNFGHRAWVAKATEETRRSSELFITHYRNKYDGFPIIPIWMLTEVITLGALSRLYEGMLSEQQGPVAKTYGVAPSVLRTWLRTLTYTRNLCAHHSRLWNRELANRPSLPRHDPLWNPPVTPTNRRLFAVLLILRRMMERHHDGENWHLRRGFVVTHRCKSKLAKRYGFTG